MASQGLRFRTGCMPSRGNFVVSCLSYYNFCSADIYGLKFLFETLDKEDFLYYFSINYVHYSCGDSHNLIYITHHNSTHHSCV